MGGEGGDVLLCLCQKPWEQLEGSRTKVAARNHCVHKNLKVEQQRARSQRLTSEKSEWGAGGSPR